MKMPCERCDLHWTDLKLVIIQLFCKVTDHTHYVRIKTRRRKQCTCINRSTKVPRIAIEINVLEGKQSGTWFKVKNTKHQVWKMNMYTTNLWYVYTLGAKELYICQPGSKSLDFTHNTFCEGSPEKSEHDSLHPIPILVELRSS